MLFAVSTYANYRAVFLIHPVFELIKLIISAKLCAILNPRRGGHCMYVAICS